MLLRLSPEQISFYWENFRPLFIDNLVPKVSRTPENVFAILQALMTERVQLWAGIEEGEGKIEERVFGFLATLIDIDGLTQERSLLLYSIFAIKPIPPTAWVPGLKILEEYKEQNKCTKLIAYSEIQEVISLCKKLGFRQYTLLVKE